MNKKMFCLLLGLIVLVSCAAEMLGCHLHSPHWWPLPFGYNAFFGFVGCWILIILSKMIMSPLLQRDEDYYEERGDGDE